MKSLGFFTPVRFEGEKEGCFEQLADGYFSFSREAAYVNGEDFLKNPKGTRVGGYEDRDQNRVRQMGFKVELKNSNESTATLVAIGILKVLSWATIIIPVIAFIAKCHFRHNHNFYREVGDEEAKELYRDELHKVLDRYEFVYAGEQKTDVELLENQGSAGVMIERRFYIDSIERSKMMITENIYFKISHTHPLFDDNNPQKALNCQATLQAQKEPFPIRPLGTLNEDVKSAIYDTIRMNVHPQIFNIISLYVYNGHEKILGKELESRIGLSRDKRREWDTIVSEALAKEIIRHDQLIRA